MSAITVILSPLDTPIFSVQDALSTYVYGYSTLTYNGYEDPSSALPGSLFSNGCTNCTAACQDPEQIFGNPFTLHNCMVMASLSPQILDIMTLSSMSLSTAQSLGIYPTASSFPALASNISQSIHDCVSQYCNLSSHWGPGCSKFHGLDCQWYRSPIVGYNDEPGGHDLCFSPAGGLCDAHVAPLNADIGGIGVSQTFQ